MLTKELTTNATEASILSQFKKINIDEPRYDQNTYLGRVKHFMDLTDMRTLFVSQSKLRECLQLLDSYKNGTLATPVDEEDIWYAKKVRDATIHPDLNTVIPLPFRMSFFVPGNLLIVAGMLQARAIGPTIFWQTVNQTYNTCVNHANRNASNEMSTTQIAVSYLCAVTSSVATAVGLNEGVKRSSLSPAAKSTITALVPFIAVSVANLFNIGLMRRLEITEGVEIKDENGEVLGKSTSAGKRAILQTVFSRITLIVPGMLIPPMVVSALQKTKLGQRNPMLVQAANISTIGLAIAVGLPLAQALFPQKSCMSGDKLEDKFKNLKDKNGSPIPFVFYNKGL